MLPSVSQSFSPSNYLIPTFHTVSLRLTTFYTLFLCYDVGKGMRDEVECLSGFVLEKEEEFE